jgi:transposase
MPAQRLTMRTITEVLRLHFECGLSQRQIAQSCGIGRATIGEYLQRAAAVGLGWPLPAGLDEATLEARLFPSATKAEPTRSVPDWAIVHRELQHKGVTLYLLWQEYKASSPEGFQYTAFTDRYRQWRKRLDVVMRQTHRAGEKLFVDYAGPTVPVVDRHTGEIRQAQIFVAVMGASAYTYAEASWTQTIPDWIGSHVRALAFFGSAPSIIIPDNLKSGVTRTHLYEPEINRTYLELANHYSVVILPARPRKPRDKSKAENGVLLVERWILARLRHQTFFSLIELNTTVLALLKELNDRPFKKLPGSRSERFNTLDRPAMQPVPETPYELSEWLKVRVNIDYHVEIDKHYYSVPYTLVSLQLDARLTQTTIEVIYRGKRIASHVRSYKSYHHTTRTEHMPKAHQEQAKWTPQRLVNWAAKTGPATAAVVDHILCRRRHPQQGFRSCLGIMRLGKTYTSERLEAACKRAFNLQAMTYRSIESILKQHLENEPLPAESTTAPIAHENLRGPDYYR